MASLVHDGVSQPLHGCEEGGFGSRRWRSKIPGFGFGFGDRSCHFSGKCELSHVRLCGAYDDRVPIDEEFVRVFVGEILRWPMRCCTLHLMDGVHAENMTCLDQPDRKTKLSIPYIR